MAQGTIYFTETMRGGNITWQGVVCQACLDEHKALIEIRRGESRTEVPYMGTRECMFCEDAADARQAEAGR